MGFKNKVDDLSIGDQVVYKSSPMDHSIPIDGRIVTVEKILPFRSRTTGNQCVIVEHDCLVRDANEFDKIASATPLTGEQKMTQSPNRFTNRADLLIAAGESIKMQEMAGVKKPIGKHEGVSNCELSGYKFDSLNWEFPIAVVEGKPVFVGDELYDGYGRLVKAEEYTDSLPFIDMPALKTDGRWYALDSYSWTAPKPAVVTVPLLREDAESLQEWIIAKDAAHERVMNAIREALEK